MCILFLIKLLHILFKLSFTVTQSLVLSLGTRFFCFSWALKLLVALKFWLNRHKIGNLCSKFLQRLYFYLYSCGFITVYFLSIPFGEWRVSRLLKPAEIRSQRGSVFLKHRKNCDTPLWAQILCLHHIKDVIIISRWNFKSKVSAIPQ